MAVITENSQYLTWNDFNETFGTSVMVTLPNSVLYPRVNQLEQAISDIGQSEYMTINSNLRSDQLVTLGDVYDNRPNFSRLAFWIGMYQTLPSDCPTISDTQYSLYGYAPNGGYSSIVVLADIDTPKTVGLNCSLKNASGGLTCPTGIVYAVIGVIVDDPRSAFLDSTFNCSLTKKGSTTAYYGTTVTGWESVGAAFGSGTWYLAISYNGSTLANVKISCDTGTAPSNVAVSGFPRWPD